MIHRVPHLSELRRICYKDKAVYGEIPNISARFIHPHVSIRITRLCLLLGIDGDTITIVMGLVGIGGALLLLAESSILQVVGCSLIIFGWILDHVDGEVLRYQGRSSTYGILLDRLSHITTYPIMHLCLGWSLSHYNHLYFVLGACDAVSIQMISSARLNVKYLKAASYPTGPPDGPGISSRLLFRVLRKLVGIYKGSIMQGFGPVIMGLLIVSILLGILPQFYVFLSVSIYLNVVVTLFSILKNAYSVRHEPVPPPKF